MTTARPAAGAIRADYPDPLWIQALNLINGEIASGSLKPGIRLPPERELCDRLQISRVTLRKALTRLVEDGVLNAAHGRGWYVSADRGQSEWPSRLESFTETARRMGLTATSIVLRSELVPASLDEAEELALAPGTPLFQLERVRLLGGVPVAIDLALVPAELVPDVQRVDFTRNSLFEQLSHAGVEMVRADSTIEAQEASADLAEKLDLEPGRPVLVMRHLVMDNEERLVLASTIRYRGDRYRLRTSFARSNGG